MLRRDKEHLDHNKNRRAQNKLTWTSTREANFSDLFQTLSNSSSGPFTPCPGRGSIIGPHKSQAKKVLFDVAFKRVRTGVRLCIPLLMFGQTISKRFLSARRPPLEHECDLVVTWLVLD